LNLVFHPSVKSEISASYCWYQKQAIGLGDDFLNELELSYGAIVELPDTWQNFRKALEGFY